MSDKDSTQGFDRRRFRDRRLPKGLVKPLATMKLATQPGAYVDVTFKKDEDFGKIAKLVAGRVAILVSLPESCGAILPETIWNELKSEFPDVEVEKGLRVLTLAVRADWYSVGLLAIIGRVLNEAQVSAGVVSSASSVHLVMKGTRLKDARVIIDLLCSQAKGRLQADKSGI